jgi:TM2 domain-containing membrane protein YozV
MIRKVDKATAYLLWVICLFGVCGLQRFYVGQVAWGIVYLFTFGFFGVGQLVDLFLIPNMVHQRNAELRRLYWAKHGHDIVALAEEMSSNSLPELNPGPSLANAPSPLQRVLKVAYERGGYLSEAQIVLHTGLTPEHVKPVLQEALRLGYADISNDPETGAVRYVFDV